MATLRQRGSPTLFMTLSSAEYHWHGLLKSVYETVYRKPATDEILDQMSATQKSRLITDNVVQTTVHFQKRIDKIMKLIMIPGYLEGESEASKTVINLEDESDDNGDQDEKLSPSYFYRYYITYLFLNLLIYKFIY